MTDDVTAIRIMIRLISRIDSRIAVMLKQERSHDRAGFQSCTTETKTETENTHKHAKEKENEPDDVTDIRLMKMAKKKEADHERIHAQTPAQSCYTRIQSLQHGKLKTEHTKK